MFGPRIDCPTLPAAQADLISTLRGNAPAITPLASPNGECRPCGEGAGNLALLALATYGAPWYGWGAGFAGFAF